jgi:hypothetical protein
VGCWFLTLRGVTGQSFCSDIDSEFMPTRGIRMARANLSGTFREFADGGSKAEKAPAFVPGFGTLSHVPM